MTEPTAPDLLRFTDRTITDPWTQPHPEPCSDCARTHPNGEHVRVQAADLRIVWEGCIDCWKRRSDPATFATNPDRDPLTLSAAEQEAIRDNVADDTGQTSDAVRRRRRWALTITTRAGREVSISLHPISLARLVAEVVDDAATSWCKRRGHAQTDDNRHCLLCGISLPDTSPYRSWLPDAYRTIREPGNTPGSPQPAPTEGSEVTEP